MLLLGCYVGLVKAMSDMDYEELRLTLRDIEQSPESEEYQKWLELELPRAKRSGSIFSKLPCGFGHLIITNRFLTSSLITYVANCLVGKLTIE